MDNRLTESRIFSMAGQSVCVCHGVTFQEIGLVDRLAEMGIPRVTVFSPADLVGWEAAVILMDKKLAKILPPELLTNHRTIIRTIGADETLDCDFLAPSDWSERMVMKMIESAFREIALVLGNRSLEEAVHDGHKQIFQLTNVGIALSVEKDLNRLLTKILKEGRNLACCDAGSLFLLEKDEGGPTQLVFKLAQNDSVACPFQEQRFPMNEQSLAGFVASRGEELNIPDVYELDDSVPYGFNKSFDENMGYRSRSMLILPMINHNSEIIGVLQFINCKKDRDIKLVSRDVTERVTLPFTEDKAELLRALASQASVAIENSVLLSNIQHLFQGFVNAAVTAIEQRDPTTSGHSFRVAELTTGLMLALEPSGRARFREIKLDANNIKEIRYASLLHDFGKVGVRESVLVKPKKLPDPGLDVIWQRFAIYKERLFRNAKEKQLDFLLKYGREAFLEQIEAFDKQLQIEVEKLSLFYHEICKSNEPTILAEGSFAHLEEIRDFQPLDVEGRLVELLTEREFLALSVRKGSLTESERREIESHVVHTYSFLKRIPWTPELSRIPDFAVAHHEKLDGTGYPLGLHNADIPLPSKAMTVADIYDALTASDRPYKKAMPKDRALDILTMEAGKGLLDRELVEIFIEAKVFDRTDPDSFKMEEEDASAKNPYHRNVCDYGLGELGF